MTEILKQLINHLQIDPNNLPKNRITNQVVRKLLMWLLTDLKNGIMFLVNPDSTYEKLIKKADHILENSPLDDEKWKKLENDAKLLADATVTLAGSDFSSWVKLSNLTRDNQDGWIIELKRMGIAAMHAASAWTVLEIARGDAQKAIDAACWMAFNATCAAMIGKVEENEIEKLGVTAFKKYREIIARKLVRLIESAPRAKNPG